MFALQEATHAQALRARISECFELASLPGTTVEQREKLLTFCVVRPQQARYLSNDLPTHHAQDFETLDARFRVCNALHNNLSSLALRGER